jgi:hypothetical protein
VQFARNARLRTSTWQHLTAIGSNLTGIDGKLMDAADEI